MELGSDSEWCRNQGCGGEQPEGSSRTCASSSILSMERGPSVVRMMSDTALAAMMLPSCAFLPVSRFWFVSAPPAAPSVGRLLGMSGRGGPRGVPHTMGG